MPQKSIRFAEGALFYDLSLILFCIQSWRAGWPAMPFSSGHSKLKYIDHELFLWVPRLRLLGTHKLWDISAAQLRRCAAYFILESVAHVCRVPMPQSGQNKKQTYGLHFLHLVGIL